MSKSLHILIAALLMSVSTLWADNITSLTQAVEGAKYTLTCNRGSLTVNAALTALQSTKDAGTTLDPADAKFQFQFVANGSDYYLYNVAAAKYSTNTGTLVESMDDAAPILLEDCGNGTARPYFDADHNINFGGSSQLVIDDWSDADGGNKFTISLVKLSTYTIVVVGLEGQGGVVIGGQEYTNGQSVETFASAVTTATAIDVTGYYSSISVEGTTITVTYTEKGAFAVNFNAETVYDPNSNLARERHMYKFALGEEEHTLAEELRTYSDQTSVTYTVKPGAAVKPALTIGTADNKAWLHGYLYLNTTDDNQFTTDELVSKTTCSTSSADDMNSFAEFTAPATAGTYRIRVKLDWSNDDPNGNDITISTISPNIIYGSVVDLTLVVNESGQPTELPEGYDPCSVENLEASWDNSEGKSNVTLTFTAPTMMQDWNWNREPLAAPITKIVINRSLTNEYNWAAVGQIDAPTAGAELSFTDENVPFGAYDYQVLVYVGEAYDFGQITSIVAGQLPAAPEMDQFTATVEGHKVTLSVVAPTLNSEGEQLTWPLTKLVLGETNMMFGVDEITALTDITAGQTYTYTIESATDGSHNYTAQFYTEAGGSDIVYVQAFVGTDQPGMVEDLTATQTADGIRVTWQAPSAGLNGGDQGDLSQLTYTISRGQNEYDAQQLATGLNSTEYLDTTVFAEETKFSYFVYATNASGDGYPTSSNELAAGPAATLPYAENFDVVVDDYGNTTTEHSSWTEETTSPWGMCAWQLGQNAYINGGMVAPHNGAGLLYAYYGGMMNANQTDSYTTGRIDFGTASAPVMTFWYYDVTGEGLDVTLTVQTSTDGVTYTDTEFQHQLGKATETGWQQASVSLSALKGAREGRVRFVSATTSENNMPVAIDEICIVGAPEGINDIHVNAHLDLNCYDLQGRSYVRLPKSGLYIQSGRKLMR